jgi:hypothetical protein
MIPNDPPKTSPSDEAAHRETLTDLGERLRATQQAAEQLAREAADAVGTGPRRPPPNGWANAAQDGRNADDLRALLGLIETARSAIPPELIAQLAELLRELLVLLRTVIDFYIERLEHRSTAPVPVEDIPID